MLQSTVNSFNFWVGSTLDWLLVFNRAGKTRAQKSRSSLGRLLIVVSPAYDT